MELIRGLHNLRERHRGSVVTIGTFDGVHRGHQALIARARSHADRLGLPLTVMTFEPNAREYFAPEKAPPRVLTLRDKLSALGRYGVDRVLLARFDRRLAEQSAQSFLEDLLVAKLGMRAMVVGDDAHFGKKRSGDVQYLMSRADELGFTVDSMGTLRVEEERCSSTLLRDALAEGDLSRAERLLGRPYTLSGRVRRGLQLGRQLGMPTANLPLRRRMALRQGVYAVRARCDSQQWPGVASFGHRPTLGLSECLLETHVLGEPGDLYGRLLEVEFRAFLRPELKFDSLDDLAAQMQRDAEDARERLLAA
jgi:riboflavin kinase/FMN adenylyltransferase